MENINSKLNLDLGNKIHLYLQNVKNIIYDYIDNDILLSKEKEIFPIIKTNDHYLFSLSSTIIFYPIYRIYFEYRIKVFDKTNKLGIFPTFKQIRKSIRNGSGFYGGYFSFAIGYFLTFSSDLLSFMSNRDERKFSKEVFIYIFSLGIAYPLFVNSNLKAIKSPDYFSLKNPLKIKNLIFNLKYFDGFLHFLTYNIIMFVPFLNLKAHRYESERIALLYGNKYGHDFKYFWEIRKFFEESGNKTRGRFLFNIFPIIYNIFALFHLYFLNDLFWKMKKNNLIKFESDDIAKYRKVMKEKYNLIDIHENF